MTKGQTLYRRLPLLIAAAVVILVLMPVTNHLYALTLLSRVFVFSILAISLDFIIGYGGLVSFGHAAYFGAGAYIVAALSFAGYSNGYLHIVAAVGGAACLAFLVGALSVRSQSIYFIMLTFAFAQMAYYFAIGQQKFGGDDGVSLPRRSDFGELLNIANPYHLYYFSLAALFVVLLAMKRIVNSRFGLTLHACKQNETRLRTLGVSTYGYKVVAFALAGGIAGLAGFFVVNLNAYVSPNFLDWKVSGDLIMMIVIGGVGTLYGGALGALVFLLLQETLSTYTDHWMAYFGLLLVVITLFWKRGLVDLLTARRHS